MTPSSRRAMIWPAIVIGILVVDVAVGIAMVRLAGNDPHAAVEADYYRKAVSWDATMAQAEQNRALGWRVEPALDMVATNGVTALRLVVRDSSGQPVPGLAVRIEARPVAHATEVRHAVAAPADSGYLARLPMDAAGLWEILVTAERGTARFTSALRLDASASGPGRIILARPGDAPPARPEP